MGKEAGALTPRAGGGGGLMPHKCHQFLERQGWAGGGHRDRER